jgi:broad specificity phosphatase PhoE
MQTVAPLAEAMRLKVEQDDALAEGSGLAALALVRHVAHEKIALCTHGDVIPEILVSLADEDHLDLGPRPRQAKGSVWILEAEGGRFVKAMYLPPAG